MLARGGYLFIFLIAGFFTISGCQTNNSFAQDDFIYFSDMNFSGQAIGNEPYSFFKNKKRVRMAASSRDLVPGDFALGEIVDGLPRCINLVANNFDRDLILSNEKNNMYLDGYFVFLPNSVASAGLIRHRGKSSSTSCQFFSAFGDIYPYFVVESVVIPDD